MDNIITYTFKELITFIDNKVVVPEIQTDLSQSKIYSMVASYYRYIHHFYSRCLITIAHLITDDVDEYYLVDGQHRIEMIRILLFHNDY